MIKMILVLFLLFTAPARAGDYIFEGWRAAFPSKEKLLALVCLASFPDLTRADNCTNSSSGPLSDAEVQAFTWFQLGTGFFATALILNNFYAAYFFYDRHEKHVANILRVHIEEIKNANGVLVKNRQKSEHIVEKIRVLLGN